MYSQHLQLKLQEQELGLGRRAGSSVSFRQGSDGPEGTSRSGGLSKQELDVLAVLRHVETHRGVKHAREEQNQLGRKLESLLGPLHAGGRLAGRNLGDVCSSSSSSVGGARRLQAPTYVGAGANELAKAMSVDKILRFREENARDVPTTRRLLTIDGSVDPLMACKPQEHFTMYLKVQLTMPLDVEAGETAQKRITRFLKKAEDADEELIEAVGPCRAFAGGTVIEVPVLDPNFGGQLKQMLSGLGLVTRKVNFSTAAALVCVQFKRNNEQFKSSLRRGPWPVVKEVTDGDDWDIAEGDRDYGPAVPSSVQTPASSTGDSRSRRRHQTMASPTGGDVQEEVEELVGRQTLPEAIARWDRHVEKMPRFWEAARQMYA